MKNIGQKLISIGRFIINISWILDIIVMIIFIVIILSMIGIFLFFPGITAFIVPVFIIISFTSFLIRLFQGSGAIIRATGQIKIVGYKKWFDREF